MIDDIREQARQDAAILHDYALVNGGVKKECWSCMHGDMDHHKPVCQDCERYQFDAPWRPANRVYRDNWRYDGGK